MRQPTREPLRTGALDEPQRLISLVLQVAPLSAGRFLEQAIGQERFYWAEPRRSGKTSPSIAAAGIAAEIAIPPTLMTTDATTTTRFEQVAQGVDDLYRDSLLLGQSEGRWSPVTSEVHPARPRLIGGFSFRPDFTPDNTWSTFYPAHFILPHYQYGCDGATAWLTLNALVAPDEDPDALAVDLGEALSARAELLLAGTPLAAGHAAAPRSYTDQGLRYPMTDEQWAEMITRATTAIRAGEMQKVVLARVGEARLAEDIDAAAALAFLDATYGDCYRFLFEAIPYHAFFGATPELLVGRLGRDVGTMALAGSIKRGRVPEEDATLAAALLASVKDNHEHALVARQIEARLRPLTESLDVPAGPDVLRLRNIQHLHTPIAGRLQAHAPATVLQLVEALHPTPALGGLPVDRAMAFISDHEPVPRGWYAAPVGWLDRAGNGAFAVAIRSAVTQYNRAWLYAGAGIVADSDPGREWAETELKFRPMLEVLAALESKDHD